MSWSTLVEGLVKEHRAAEADAIEDILSRYGDDVDRMSIDQNTQVTEDGTIKTTEIYWNKIHLASVIVKRQGTFWEVYRVEYDLSETRGANVIL